MTTNSDDASDRTGRTRRRSRKYIPHLAEFYFRPDHDWTTGEACKLFEKKTHLMGGMALDTVLFDECVKGMQQLPESSIDLVIADPPFGIDFNGKSGVYNRDDSFVIEGYTEAQGSYEGFTVGWIDELPRVMKQHASAYIFSGWNNLEFILRGAREAELVLLNHIIWHYPFGVFTKKRFVTSHYHVLLFAKDPREYFFNKFEHYPEDVWRINRQYRAGQEKNSTKLPLEVVNRCIDFSSRPGDVVLDPFMGNGTTAVAAKGNWRHFVGFEVNPRLKPIIDSETGKIEPGQMYRPYTQRLPSIEELGNLYPRAYREYLKAEKAGKG